MPKRKELQGIANSLISQLCSRNNDYLGYWAIGQLCELSKKEIMPNIVIDITRENTLIESLLLSGIQKECASYLKTQLEKKKIPSAWVIEAKYSISFSDDKSKNYTQWGHIINSYICSLSLISDAGIVYSAKDGGSCVPHTTHKEQRRRGF